MSKWTYVISSMLIDTFREDKDIENYVKQKLKTFPKITGSEKDAEVFVNKVTGHNVLKNMDCEHCKYKNTIIRDLKNNSFTCDSPENFKCPKGKYQTCLVITISGSLRDRDFSKTKKELEAFINQILELKFNINVLTATIFDDYKRKCTLIPQIEVVIKKHSYAQKIKYNWMEEK